MRARRRFEYVTYRYLFGLRLSSFKQEQETKEMKCSVEVRETLYTTDLSKCDNSYISVWFTWMLPLLQGKKTEKPVQDFIVRCLEDIVK